MIQSRASTPKQLHLTIPVMKSAIDGFYSISKEKSKPVFQFIPDSRMVMKTVPV